MSLKTTTMSSFWNKRILYVVSQGLVTAMSAVIVVVLSSYGDSANVVKFGVYFSILAVLQSTLSLRYELGLYTDGGRNREVFLATAVMNTFFLATGIILTLVLLDFFGVGLWTFRLYEALLIVIACAAANICMVLKQYYVASGVSKIATQANVISIIIFIVALMFSPWIDPLALFPVFLVIYIFTYTLVIFYWLLNSRPCIGLSLTNYYSGLKKGSDFLKFSTPGMLFNVLGNNIVILYFGAAGTVSEVAQLVVIMRLILLPIGLLSLPLSHIVSAKVMKCVAGGIPTSRYLYGIISSLLVCTLVYVVFLSMVDDDWLTLIGVKPNFWSSYFPVLAVLFVFRMTVSPLSNVLNVLKKEWLLFALQAGNLLAIGSLFLVGPQQMLGGVQLYVAVSVVFQTVVLWFIFRESRAFERSL